MLNKTINKLPKSLVEVQIEIPWTDMAPLWQQAVQNYATQAEIPGFRKGQIPLDMIEERFSTQVQQELLKTAMPQSLMAALQGTDLIPIDYPQYTNIDFRKGEIVRYKASFAVRPVVTIGNYKSIKVARPALKPITDEDAGKVIEDLFKRWKARQPASTVGGPAQGTPENPDDNFAKQVGATDLNDLKTKIKQDLENEAKYNNELDYEEAILQEVEKITQVDIPDILVQDELNRMLVSLQRNVADKGILMDEYLKSQGETVDTLKNKWRPQAEKNVRMELGLSEIARQENVSISDPELQAEIDKIQDGRLKQQFASEEPKMHLRHALRQTKTLNLLKTLVPAS